MEVVWIALSVATVLALGAHLLIRLCAADTRRAHREHAEWNNALQEYVASAPCPYCGGLNQSRRLSTHYGTHYFKVYCASCDYEIGQMRTLAWKPMHINKDGSLSIAEPATGHLSVVKGEK